MTTGNQTQAPPAADIPVEEPTLNWKDIRRLLKEKLTSESFTKTLRYSQEHEHVPLSDIIITCTLHLLDRSGITRLIVTPVSENLMFRSFLFGCGIDVDGSGMRRILNELFLCSDFDLPNRAASSEGDDRLANLIFAEFEKQIMEPWTDEHYVQLQTPNRFDATHTHTH